MPNEQSDWNNQILGTSELTGETRKIIVSNTGVIKTQSEAQIDSGLATTGGTDTTLVDANRNYEVNKLQNKIIKILVNDILYVRTILSNTVNTFTFASLGGLSSAAVIGAALSGQVRIITAERGLEGHDYTVEVVDGDGENLGLDVDFTDGVLTVTLGTDENGDPDDSKNTAALIAAEIAELDEFTTNVDNAGVVSTTEEPIPFIGGEAVVNASANTYYSIIENNPITSNNIQVDDADVSDSNPVPVDIQNADINVNVTVEDIVSVEQDDRTKLNGIMSIDQVTANANEVVVKSIAAGDNNIGNVDIVTLPSGNLGQQLKTASLSVAPASDIADETYIGDIKFGEKLPAGDQVIGKLGIDQTTDGTTNKVQARNATHDDFNVNANVQFANTDINVLNPLPVDTKNLDCGTASVDGTATTLVDTTKNYATNLFQDKLIKIIISGISYFRSINSNAKNSFTFDSLGGSKATAVAGLVEAGQVTVETVDSSSDYNDYTLEIADGVGVDIPLSAAFADDVLTVTLATDGTGAVDNSVNTATAVAGVIDALPDFTATMTGSGGVMSATVSPIEFTGGESVVSTLTGSYYTILDMYPIV